MQKACHSNCARAHAEVLITGASLALKSLLLVGLILDAGHFTPRMGASLRETLIHLPFHAGFILLFLWPGFLLGDRKRGHYLLGLNLLLTLLFACDILYYRGFSAMPTPHTLSEAGNLHGLWSSIAALLSPYDVLFFIDIPLFLIWRRTRPSAPGEPPRPYLLALATLAAALLLLILNPLRDRIAHRDLEFTTCSPYDSTFTCRVMSPLGYHLYTLWTAPGENRRVILSTDERETIRQWFEANREIRPPNRYHHLFRGYNLIVIQVESLEGFVINRSVAGQEITPTLNRILKHSLYFPNLREQTGEGTSSDADLMTNTSIYPIRRGSSFFRYPHTTYPSLPRLLAEAGYTTLAVEPEEGSFWNWIAAEKSIGFQHCLDISRFIPDETINLGLSDASFLRQLVPVITARKPPFYLLTCTLTSHTPFILPASCQGLRLDAPLASTVMGNYLQACHYTDRHLGLFLEALDQAGTLDQTVVVLYGDHEGVHKYLRPQVELIQPSEAWWRENDHHIPLIIYQKHLSGEIIPVTGGQIDLCPTLAALLGVDEGPLWGWCMGRNLLNTGRSFVLLRDGSFRGDPLDKDLASHVGRGPEIADLIIRGNYFAPSR